MKLINSIISIAFILLTIFSAASAGPLPIPEASTMTSSIASSVNHAILPRQEAACEKSGGWWHAGPNWCVCKDDYVPINDVCAPGQGYYNGAIKNNAGLFGLTVACAAAMAVL